MMNAEQAFESILARLVKNGRKHQFYVFEFILYDLDKQQGRSTCFHWKHYAKFGEE